MCVAILQLWPNTPDPRSEPDDPLRSSSKRSKRRKAVNLAYKAVIRMTDYSQTLLSNEDRLSPVNPARLSPSIRSFCSTPDSDQIDQSGRKEKCEADDQAAIAWGEETLFKSSDAQGYLIKGEESEASVPQRLDPPNQPVEQEPVPPMIATQHGSLPQQRLTYEYPSPSFSRVPRQSHSVYEDLHEQRRPPILRLSPPSERSVKTSLSPLKRELDELKDDLGSYKLPRLQRGASSSRRVIRETDELPHIKDIFSTAPASAHRRTYSSSTVISTVSAPARFSASMLNSPASTYSAYPYSPASPYTNAIWSPTSSITLSADSPSHVHLPNNNLASTPRRVPVGLSPPGLSPPVGRDRVQSFNSTASSGSTLTTQDRESSESLSSDTDMPTPRRRSHAMQVGDSTHDSSGSPTQDHSADGSAARAGPSAGFRCKHEGCQAAPFATQYLLNSHKNVHSQDRPHFCPVGGCRRGPGGRGFKRKNEMIRHQLVHNSPGYVCPYCPDQSHRYPRPDNLQRHVTLHHKDKDKTDHKLREVLAVKPVGMSSVTGRRRRAT